MEVNKKIDIKNIFKEWVPVSLMAISTLVFSILFKQEFIKVLPMFISIVVMLLNSRANRYGLVLASINCCIYCIGYYKLGLYGSIFSALFQAVLGMITFFLWTKRKYGSSTIMRKLTTGGRIGFAAISIASWMTMFLITRNLDGVTLPFIDSFLTVMGILITLLNMFAFIEAPCTNIFVQMVGLGMYINIVFIKGLQEITYVCYGVYTLYMVIIMAITYIKLYKKQQAEQKDKNQTQTEVDSKVEDKPENLSTYNAE